MYYLYVIRHGETEWNTEKRFQGRADSELTEKGVKDAQLLNERLLEVEFNRIISSPNNRTMKTAMLVKGDKAVPIETDERLLEMHLGEWQGLRDDEIKKQYPEKYHSYWNEPDSYESIGGENFFDVKNRIANFLLDLEKTKPTGNVLVVTHGVVIKALYLLCKNEAMDQLWNPPFIHGTSLTIIRVQDSIMELCLEACIEHCS